MSTAALPQELKRGDVLTGWNYAPVGIVEAAPKPHPTKTGWWLVEVATPYGVGTRVFGEGMTASVGRVPLKNLHPNSLLGMWVAPCGCEPHNGEHCTKCGPYNTASPSPWLAVAWQPSTSRFHPG